MHRRCLTFPTLLMLFVLVPMAEAAEPKLTVILESPQVKNPFGVDFDEAGNVFVAEYLGGRLLKLDSRGALSVVSGNGTEGFAGDGDDAAKAIYNGIHNVIRLRNGDLILSDTRNNLLRKIDAKTNKVSTIAGVPGKKGFSGDGGLAVKAKLADPISISLSQNESQLLIADIHNRRIRAIDLETGLIRTVAGNGERGAPREGGKALEEPLADPRACAMDSKGQLYILERGGHALRVVRPDGRIYTVAGTGKKGYADGPADKAQFAGPKHLCFDSDGNLLIADDLNHAIRLFNPRKGVVVTVLGREALPKTTLKRPHGVRVDPTGRLWVCDSWNDRVLVLSSYSDQ